MIVFKYPLILVKNQKLRLPKGAKVLSAQLQKETIFLWAEIDPGNPVEERTFSVICTGVAFDDKLEFIDTVQQSPYVWHIYEKVCVHE